LKYRLVLPISFSQMFKNIARVICLVFVLYIALPPLIQTWNWREDQFKLFDLSIEMQKNDTNFYTWLGVEVNYLLLPFIQRSNNNDI
jgi:hypothetical protein